MTWGPITEDKIHTPILNRKAFQSHVKWPQTHCMAEVVDSRLNFQEQLLQLLPRMGVGGRAPRCCCHGYYSEAFGIKPPLRDLPCHQAAAPAVGCRTVLPLLLFAAAQWMGHTMKLGGRVGGAWRPPQQKADAFKSVLSCGNSRGGWSAASSCHGCFWLT